MRLFVAFPMPSGLVAVPEGLGLRPIDDVHMTLAFLGEQEAPEPVCAAVAASLSAPGPLVATRFMTLPRRRPRVLAVLFDDPSGACNLLQASVTSALASAGLLEPESRPWLPHVSIARLGRDGPPPRPRALPDVPDVSWTPSAVAVIRSHLGGSRPARYEVLRSWELPPR